jgi:hypothetical protein
MKKLLIGLAVVVAGAILTVPANAASRACGNACLTLTAQEFGPEYVSAVPLGSVTAGDPIVMAPGSSVTLEPCYTPLRTEWIALPGDEDGDYMPLISGTDTSTTDPQVLTANSQSAALTTRQLTTFPGNAYPATNQMWEARYGIIRTYAISHNPPPL